MQPIQHLAPSSSSISHSSHTEQSPVRPCLGTSSSSTKGRRVSFAPVPSPFSGHERNQNVVTSRLGKNGSFNAGRNSGDATSTHASSASSAAADEDMIVRQYETHRDRLSRAIEESVSLLADLRNFNENQWVMKYPLLAVGTPAEQGKADSAAISGDGGDDVEGGSSSTGGRRSLKRAMTMTMAFADNPEAKQEVCIQNNRNKTQNKIKDTSGQTFSSTATPGARPSPVRSFSMVPISSLPHKDSNSEQLVDEQDDDLLSTMIPSDFSILRLDLSLGSATAKVSSLMSNLERTSISRLLSSRFESSLSHLSQLQSRIMSTSSRVLVTGDLNAGKSTLINALLRRGGVGEDGWVEGVMPVDQQPLTGRFVEVFSSGNEAHAHTDAEEQVHLVASGQETKYDPSKPETFTLKQLDHLPQLVVDQAADDPPLKVYLRSPSTDLANPSILHNGVLNISLIDAPGLNRDVHQTTATFTQSPTIDVVIFVVSAANHFTLSAKEFILSAGQEKARMFVVVNRFDEVRDKERCRRVVLEQIKTLSPKTYEERDELVHFVDSARIALKYSEGLDGEDAEDSHMTSTAKKMSSNKTEEELDASFAHLEQSLRSFVLINRAKSKLGPAEHYLTHLMADVSLLASANAVVAASEYEAIRERLHSVRPGLEGMKQGRDGLEAGLDEEEDRLSAQVLKSTKEAVEKNLAKVGNGQLAVKSTNGGPLRVPSYPGLLGVWDYAIEVRKTMLRSLDLATTQLEEETKNLTTLSVANVGELGEQHLPADVERSKRIFNPDAMFASSTTGKLVRRKSSAIVPLGLGLASRPELYAVSVSDLFDLHHHVLLVKEYTASRSSASEKPKELPVLGMASMAAGALTVYSGASKFLGLKQALDSVTSIADFVNNQNVQRWALPVVGAVVIGAGVYIVYDLPRSIPRNVGRQIQATLEASGYADAEATRMQKEARKVVRLASWDLRERFRAALEEKGKIVREGEEQEKVAIRALEWFEDVQGRVGMIREQMGSK